MRTSPALPSLNRARSRLRRGGIAALVLTLLMVTGGLVAQGLAARTGLPLGAPRLTEARTETQLAPGVTLTRITRGGKAAPADQVTTTNKGPWRIRVLTIDPKLATGHLRATRGPDMVRTETTSDLVRSLGALAGVNGSFFSLTYDPAHAGDPVGLAVHRGEVVSGPSGLAAEKSFVLDAATNHARVAELHWSATLTAPVGAGTLTVDDVNRPPRTGELVSFTAGWGARTPPGSGAEVVLDPKGCPVRTATRRGTSLTPGQTSLQATGLAVTRMLELAALGCLVHTDTLIDARDRPLVLRPSHFILSGRHQLVRNGALVAPEGTAGFLARAPRTLAGVAKDGRVLLVTIDGRSTTSVGVTLAEAAKVARALGMDDALNLDGGGSTAMSVRGATENRPSGGRERAVGDAVVYLPGPWREDS